MKDYLMIILAVALLALGFVMQKIYQKRTDDTTEGGVDFSIISGLFSIVILILTSGFSISFTWYSMINAVLKSTCCLAYTIIGFRIMKESSVSIYMLFLMSGGMLVPSVWGWIFLNEDPKPLHILGEDIVFRVHTLEEEVRANNFVARSTESKFTKEFAEMDFQNFYNAKADYQDLTAWFKFEWSDAEEILYTFEDTNEPKYALHKKHKMIAALKQHGKGEVILTTLSCLDGCLGCNPVLDKLIINFIEKE